MGCDAVELRQFRAEATSGDYENLLDVVGKWVDLETYEAESGPTIKKGYYNASI